MGSTNETMGQVQIDLSALRGDGSTLDAWLPLRPVAGQRCGKTPSGEEQLVGGELHLKNSSCDLESSTCILAFHGSLLRKSNSLGDPCEKNILRNTSMSLVIYFTKDIVLLVNDF